MAVPSPIKIGYYFDSKKQSTGTANLFAGERHLLIFGLNGAGKSTLAFSTLCSSLRYLSDDYCVLAPGDPPRALALYHSSLVLRSRHRLH